MFSHPFRDQFAEGNVLVWCEGELGWTAWLPPWAIIIIPSLPFYLASCLSSMLRISAASYVYVKDP